MFWQGGVNIYDEGQGTDKHALGNGVRVRVRVWVQSSVGIGVRVPCSFTCQRSICGDKRSVTSLRLCSAMR